MSECSSSRSVCPFTPSEHAHLCLNGSKIVLMFSNPDDAPYQPSFQSIACAASGFSKPENLLEAINGGSHHFDESSLQLVPCDESNQNETIEPIEVDVKTSVFSLRNALSRATSLFVGAFKSSHGRKFEAETTQNSSDETKSSGNRNLNYCVGRVLTNNDGVQMIKKRKKRKTISSKRRREKATHGCSLYNLTAWAQSVLHFVTRAEKKRRKMKKKRMGHKKNVNLLYRKSPSQHSSVGQAQLMHAPSNIEDSGFQFCYFITCLGQEKLNKLLTRTKSQETLDTVLYLTSQAPRALSRMLKTVDTGSRVDIARLQVLYEDFIGGGDLDRWNREAILNEFTKKMDERSLKNLESHLKRNINNYCY